MLKPVDTEVDVDQLLGSLIGLKDPSPPFLSLIPAVLNILNIDGSVVLKAIPPLLAKTPIDIKELVDSIIEHYDSESGLTYKDLIDAVGDSATNDLRPSL